MPIGFTFRQIVISSLKSIIVCMMLSFGLFLIRDHLSVATVALILVIPVVLGVISGGFFAGVAATIMGFFIYDYFFIKPYYTLSVGAAQNWAALGVYVVVMITLSQMVTKINTARMEAQRRAKENRELFDLSELLLKDSSIQDISEYVLDLLLSYFKLTSAVLFIQNGDKLTLTGKAGISLEDDEIRNILNKTVHPIRLEPTSTGNNELSVVVLSSQTSDIGLLAIKGLSYNKDNRELFKAFINHLSYALERTLLRDQVMKTELLQKADEIKNSLVGAVSHDLRTPLSAIKISSSTILESNFNLSNEELTELLFLIDFQATKLDRLVGNLLDMTRIESGTLVLKKENILISNIVDECLENFKYQDDFSRINIQNKVPKELVFADKILLTQALVNLVDNALKYSPENESVDLIVEKPQSNLIKFVVRDYGPGLDKNLDFTYLNLFNKNNSGGRGGLGLAIAFNFIKSTGGDIKLNKDFNNGTEFEVTLSGVA